MKVYVVQRYEDDLNIFATLGAAEKFSEQEFTDWWNALILKPNRLPMQQNWIDQGSIAMREQYMKTNITEYEVLE
jgi:hypothetical protein